MYLFLCFLVSIYSPASFTSTSNGKPAAPLPSIVIPNNSNNGQLIPNKSTLFATQSPQSQSPQPQSPIINHHHHQQQHQSSSPTPPKPVINHGKPNLAPKPPGMVFPPNAPTNGIGSNNNNASGAPARPTVARHQSMRSPRFISHSLFFSNPIILVNHTNFLFRSPPIAMTNDGPVFPSKTNNFGTIRSRNNFSTDEINKPSLIGKYFILFLAHK